MVLVRYILSHFCVNFLHVPDDDAKMTSPNLPGGNYATSVGQQLSAVSRPTSIGPAEFLELYRTRTVSDPRSDQCLDALSHVRMKKVSTCMTTCLSP